MNFQIDIKPADEGYKSHSIDLFIDGRCYNVLALASTVEQMKNNGLVKQVKGQCHNEKNELVEFEYPNSVDSAGVQFTSKVYTLTELKH